MNNHTDLYDSLDPLLKPGRIVLIGEWHGTNEFPDLVGHLADRCAQQGHAVTIAIEIACSEQENITRFVEGNGDARLDGPWWHRSSEFQDGRSSEAVARLIHTASDLVNQGHDVHVAPVDGPWVAPGSPIDPSRLHLIELPRDQVMATYTLEVIDERPNAVTLMLAGSRHTRVKPLVKNVQPAGRYIHTWHPNTIALVGRTSGGTAWTLQRGESEGRVHTVPDDAALKAEAVWATDPGRDGHHGYLHVGDVSASPPFVGGSKLPV